MIYVVNVCTDTKSTDRYSKVAVNEYPWVIVGDKNYLLDQLGTDKTKQAIKLLLRTYQLYQQSVYRVREVDENGVKESFELYLPKYTEVNYNEE